MTSLFACAITHPYVRAMTHSIRGHSYLILSKTHKCVCHDSFIRVSHDSFICVPWHIHIMHNTYSSLQTFDTHVRAMIPVFTCTMTHSYVCYDSFTSWAPLTDVLTHTCVCVPKLLHSRAPWLSHMCAMTPSLRGHSSRISTNSNLIPCMPWLLRFVDTVSTNSFAWWTQCPRTHYQSQLILPHQLQTVDGHICASWHTYEWVTVHI